MELRTLNQYFEPQKVLEDFISAIWTERFTEAGDMELQMPMNHPRAKDLAPGNLIGLVGSKETMMIETREIKDKIITAKGRTIETFLDQRGAVPGPYSGPPGYVVAEIAHKMQERAFGVYAIPRFTVGERDMTGADVREDVAVGPAYSAMLSIAQKYLVGMLLWGFPTPEGMGELNFSTYRGVDRTSDQSTHNLIRFSPDLDNLANVSELLSIANYKTVVLAYPPTSLEGWQFINPSIASVVPVGPQNPVDNEFFDRRVLEFTADDINKNMYGDANLNQPSLRELLDQRALRKLSECRKTKLVDGEALVNPKYRYGEHYKLGDRVEMQGYYGEVMKGTFTEHVRSQDGSGERSYPSVKVGEAEAVTTPGDVVNT